MNSGCQYFKLTTMRYILLLTFICLTHLACKKCNPPVANPLTSDLAGKWRMVQVKDNSTNIISIKPSAITGNVDINFTFSSSSAGLMTGATPTNTLNADFSTGSNQTLSIPGVSTTKVIETSWGNLFLDNITYSQNFFIDADRKLNINASTNQTLTFVRQ